MIQNRRAFSLVEVVVATSILSLSVFWVYRLIWENNKLLYNSSHYLQSNMLFVPFKECIEYLWFDSFSSSSIIKYNFNFWNDMTWCFTWTTNIIEIDKIEYTFSWAISSSWYTVWEEFINWDLEISNDQVWVITHTYKQIKR